MALAPLTVVLSPFFRCRYTTDCSLVEFVPVQAYVYLKRFVSLALDGLPRHRKYPGGVDASDRAWLQKVRGV